VKLYSIAKASKVMGIDRGTINKAIEKGQIKAVEVGKRKWISEKELERLTEAKNE